MTYNVLYLGYVEFSNLVGQKGLTALAEFCLEFYINVLF